MASVSLGPATVARRTESLSEDVSQQMLMDLSLQSDQSVDMTDAAQLMVFVQMALADLTTKEDFLTLTTEREDERRGHVH